MKKKRANQTRKYRKLPVKVKAHTGEFEAIRQYYSLPVDTPSRNSLLRFIAENAFVKSFLIAAAEEALAQFAQCNNDPVLKIDLNENGRIGITIDAEVMSAEADARLDSLRDWSDKAQSILSAIYFDVE